MSLRRPDPYTGPIVPGLDVSVYQEHVDWHRVAATGRKFAIARVAFGLHADRMFVRHYTEAREAGLVPGAYLYFRPGQPTLDQAKRAADTIGPFQRPGDLPVALDIERAEGLDPKHIEIVALACLQQLERELGKKPMVYAGAFVAQFVAAHHLAAFPLWTPWYGDGDVRIPRAWEHWTFAQTSGSARVDGVMDEHGRPSAVDVDEFRGDLAAFDAFRGA